MLSFNNIPSKFSYAQVSNLQRREIFTATYHRVIAIGTRCDKLNTTAVAAQRIVGEVLTEVVLDWDEWRQLFDTCQLERPHMTTWNLIGTVNREYMCILVINHLRELRKCDVKSFRSIESIVQWLIVSQQRHNCTRWCLRNCEQQVVCFPTQECRVHDTARLLASCVVNPCVVVRWFISHTPRSCSINRIAVHTQPLADVQ